MTSDTSPVGVLRDSVRTGVREVTAVWGWFLALGIFWVGYGTFVLSYRVGSLAAVATLVGTAFLVGGVTQLAVATRIQSWRWLFVLGGIVGIAAGITTFAWPGITLYVVSVFVAWYLVVFGVMHLVGALSGPKVTGWWTTLLLRVAELRNRGVRDVLIVCCDGLTGFPEAIEATWPQTTVQTCTVHLIRAAMRFVSYNDRKKVAAALRPIYTAPTVEAAETELLTFADSELGRKYPATVATWENAWQRFIPFLAFPPEVRKIIYTTNSIESLNYQLRKIIKNRGHFPNDDAVIKLLWLAIRDIEDKRARARAKEKGAPRDQRKAPGRLVEGAVVQGWKQALGALALR